MELLSLAILGVLIVISPGADFVLVLKNSLNSGRKAGIATAIGISLAICVHIAYSLLGISYLISQNQWLFNLVRYVGAAYLIYLGLKGIFAKRDTQEILVSHKQHNPSWRYFLQGFLCNALNPKTMLFFLSIFSQVMSPDADNNWPAIFYGGYMIVLHGVWFSLVAILFTSPKLQAYLQRAKHRINQVCGAGLLLFGAMLGLKS